MRRKNAVLIFLMTACLALAIGAPSAGAYTFSLVAKDGEGTTLTQIPRGEWLYLDIQLDNAAGVAGAAFTLNFNDTFLAGPTTDADGVSAQIQSSFPFYSQSQSASTHRENASVPGKIYFSGAAINESANEGGALSDPGEILFTVPFQVKMDATLGTATDIFSLVQTELWNLAAGYGTDDGDEVYEPGIDTLGKVPVLVGAVSKSHADWDNLASGAFPILMGDQASPMATLSLEVVACLDDDSDGFCNVYETNTGTYGGPTDTGTDPNNPDTDADGYLDGSDAAPLAQNDPGQAGYDPSTDTRTYGISGAVHYAGSRTGKLYVKAYDDAGLTNEIGSVTVDTPSFSQNYTISGVPAAYTYYLKAFVDEDADNTADNHEPDGTTSLAITADMSGNDITLPLKIYLTGTSVIPINVQKTYRLMTEVPDGKTLKAYNIQIDYDTNYVSLVSATTDGLTTFPPTNINSGTAGTIIINGLDTTGVAGPANFGLIDITFEGAAEGSAAVTITVNDYGLDVNDQFPPQAVGKTLEVVTYPRGDADGNYGVDIFDALMVAEYDALLKTEGQVPGFAVCDVDDSGGVDIFDALKIAEYDAGLIPNLD